jgi:hypothetical protein
MAAALAEAEAVGLGNVSEAEVLRQIDNLKQYMETHKETLPGRIYAAMDGISRTALKYLDKKESKGWATGVLDATGEAIWSPEQAAVLEQAAPAAIIQVGGALNPMKFTASSQLVQPQGSMPPISMDGMRDAVIKTLAAVDQKNREIASVVGPVAFVKSLKMDPSFGPYPPYFPFMLKFPAGLILPSINAFLETLRILVSSKGYDNEMLRKIFSVVLATFDVMRGEWRDGVLSILGVFGNNYMFLGMLGKTARWVYNWMSPDIQARLEDDVYAGAKSMFVGGWLWLLSVVSPDFVRNTINTMLETAKKPVEELNQKLEDLEQKAQSVAGQAGVSVEFPKIPLERFPSFDDIQNFQSLLSNPEIYCSAEFQTVLAPALAIPPLRIMLELLNIPTLPEKIQERCKGMPQSISDSIAQSLKPIVLPLPTAESSEPKEEPNPAPATKGGGLVFASRKRLTRKRLRRTS